MTKVYSCQKQSFQLLFRFLFVIDSTMARHLFCAQTRFHNISCQSYCSQFDMLIRPYIMIFSHNKAISWNDQHGNSCMSCDELNILETFSLNSISSICETKNIWKQHAFMLNDKTFSLSFLFMKKVQAEGDCLLLKILLLR